MQTTMQAPRGFALERLTYRVEVHDRDGNLLDHEEGPAKSLIRAWGAVVTSLLSGANVAAVKNKAGIAKTLDFDALTAGPAQVAMGTGDTAVAIDQNALVAEDSALDATITVTTDTAAKYEVTAWKSMPSVLGLTVKEIGLFLYLNDVAPAPFYFLVARDVVADKIVPALGSVTVKYTFTYVP